MNEQHDTGFLFIKTKFHKDVKQHRKRIPTHVDGTMEATINEYDSIEARSTDGTVPNRKHSEI